MEPTRDLGPSAPVLEMMEQGATVMRIENENLQAMAIQKPRKVRELTQAAFDELRMFPQFAAKAYYSIPYKDRSSGAEQTVMVEGPSIKAANALTRHWGNNSSGFRIVGSDEERITIQGVFIDHETGMRRTAEISVSRKARKRDGTYYTLAADRLNMAIQAGGSKAVRNAILNALPIGLVDMYFQEAKGIAARGGKQVAVKGSPDDTAAITAQMEQCLTQFEQIGVERKEVSDYVGNHPELKNKEDVCAHLIGVLNAIADNQTTVEEVFTVQQKPISEPQRATAPQTPPPAQPKSNAGNAKVFAAKFDGANCPVCNKQMKKGQSIFKGDKGYQHEGC